MEEPTLDHRSDKAGHGRRVSRDVLTLAARHMERMANREPTTQADWDQLAECHDCHLWTALAYLAESYWAAGFTPESIRETVLADQVATAVGGEST